ncbi:putative ras-related protein rab [Trypanosoma rangeli]|uniref:Putative ras-related protein rab n=1 Tax=Trypanosoma rangeli TaxID=5698 RepID=A0A3R7M2I5_TRYRA|nr:putative ras-related protein rab [Trypanosoma rangeli]RNE98166.1 putative ras-related protein rab [Trypanosoma rangeli]|eukprot:RNE98166.1 putative ras-related protein rab [Trypanosoma rangeli]
MTRELDIKVVCVGAANTGKTTFLRYWETGESPLHLSTTIQMEFHRREMCIVVPSAAYFEQRHRPAGALNTTVDAAHKECHEDQQTQHKEDTVGSRCGDTCKGNVHSCVQSHGVQRHLASSTEHISTVSGVRRCSAGSSGGRSYAFLQNPFGSEYAIAPPQLPPFYAMASACGGTTSRCGSTLTGNDVQQEGEAQWSLLDVPAIVKVWDIQGQESTKRMTRVFYTGAIAVLIFCEMSNGIDTLTSALSWRSDVAQKIHISKGKLSNTSTKAPSPHGGDSAARGKRSLQQLNEETENPPCWLVINKYDLLAGLTSPPTWASHAALDELCARHGFAGWSYAAGRRGVNVEAVVRAVIAAAVDRFPQLFSRVWDNSGVGADPNDSGGAGTVVLRTRRRPQQHQRNGCCSK